MATDLAMTLPHYSSGDEIKPNDKIICEDGVHGRVAFTLDPGETNHTKSPASHLNQGFFVERSDGTTAHYQPSDHGVKFVSRVGPMTSNTMNETIKREEFLKLLEDLGSHSTYYPDPLVKHLTECGLSVAVTLDGQGIALEGQLIPVSAPEWGEPGINPMSILCVVYEIATGESPQSDMTGRGFRYRQVMDMLAKHWGLESKYL